MSSNNISVNNSTVESLDKKLQSEGEKQHTQNLYNLISDIENSKEINNVLTNDSISEDMPSELFINSTINQTADTLRTINSIKDELCKLPLDTCENQYIANNIVQLVNTLYLLSNSSYNLSNSVSILNTSPLVHPKKSELKDTIHLIYDINEECEDLFKVIKKRLKVLY